jgi:hypothetical protein
MYAKLYQLKIPSGWAVIKHSFGNEDPVVDNGFIVNDEFYSEDLLSIERLFFNGTDWVTDPDGYVLDPESEPQGCYRFTLIRANWENVIVQYESKNREEIRKIIEQCFDLITQGIDEKNINSFIKQSI